MAFDSNFQPDSIIFKAFLCILLVKATISYEEINLSHQDVCKLDFELGYVKVKSALLIKDGEYFTSQSGRYDFNCKFVVRSKDKDYGLYAVIQELNFRKNENDSCKDFIEMSVPTNDITKIFSNSRRSPKKFCGNMSPGMWLNPDDSNDEVNLNIRDVAPNAYVATHGEIYFELSIARDRLQIRERLRFTVAFTTFKKGCRNDENTFCRYGECIDSSFKQDNIQNCPYVSCADEMGCASLRVPTDDDSTWHKDMVGSTIGTKVAYEVVSIVVVMIIAIAFGSWLYKRYKVSSLNPIRTTHHEVPRTEPSAPPMAIEEIETKDLPPSYESLYPTDLPSRVTFGAIAAIVMMIVTFAICICLFKRCKLNTPRQRRNPNLRPVLERTESIIEPTAPPVIEEIETKDLPPSYDSLYPTQSQPNSQS